MQIKITKTFNAGTKLEIDVEDKDEREAIAKALFFTAPDYCGLCKSTNIIWQTNKAKDAKGDSFTYIKRFCLACKAQSTAGEYKDGGFFWKRWEIYQGNSAPAAVTPPAQTTYTPPPDEIRMEDLNF